MRLIWCTRDRSEHEILAIGCAVLGGQSDAVFGCCLWLQSFKKFWSPEQKKYLSVVWTIFFQNMKLFKNFPCLKRVNDHGKFRATLAFVMKT